MGYLRRSTHNEPLLLPSMFLLRLILLLSVLSFTVAAAAGTTISKGCLEAERDALMAFKAGVRDPSRRLSSWRGHDDCCRWSGVVCDDTTGGHVVELNLQNPSQYYDPNAALRGEISPSLLSLTHLVRLNLTQNDFGGTPIPKFLGSFNRLRYLDLSSSNFSGAIPPQLGNSSSLVYLGLRSSDLSPTRADELEWLPRLSSLKYLDMGFVNLSKASNGWLRAVNMLPSLETLLLGECGLRSLPSFLSHVNITSLSTLDLSGNLFNSTFPSWLPQLRSLSNLALSDSQLHGTIPAAIRNLSTSLTQLDLSGNSLSGPIAGIWNSTRLTRLEISYNLFTGSIPAAIGNLIGLSQLYIVGCKLTGLIPPEIGYLTNLSEVELTANSLNGSVPFEIGNLTSLSQLKLDKNSLSGSLPVEIGKLTNLTVLDLSLNSLEGIVSEHHFANLTNLVELYLFGNSLVFAIGQNWVPPFQINAIALGSNNLGPKFPGWLRSQELISTLDLSNTSIEGTLPDWFWNAYSSSIMTINLSHNKINGILPASLENMTNLSFFNLSSNLFEGTIPLLPPNIQSLDLSRNQFSRSLPSAYPSQLVHLFLSYNHINGSIPFSICNLTQLIALDLSSNQISGEIPPCWQLEATDFIFMNLANNKLHGEIPSSIGNLIQLKFLHLNSNNLHGRLPLSLKNCSQLAIIDLGGNNFSGKIPTWIAQNFQYLEVLRLRSNVFTGNIPPQLGQLSNLQIIDLAGNRLSGTIPPSFGNLSAMATSKTMNSTISTDELFTLSSFVTSENITLVTKGDQQSFSSILSLVKSIDLSHNELTGAIPTELGLLSALQTLNLSRNGFQGMIPSTIGGMKSLETLDLSFNKLFGVIPQSFSLLNYLNHLNLSYNNLSGAIPSGYQLQTLDDASIYIGNVYLCGAPLAKNCSNDENINFANEENEEGSQMLSFYLSVVLGFLIGLWSVFVLLLFKRDWRYYYFRMIDAMYDKAYVVIRLRIRRLKSTK